MVDYFSKYPEVARLSHKTTEAVILAMKAMVARHGFPERLIADKYHLTALNLETLPVIGRLK